MKFKVKIIKRIRQVLNAEIEVKLSPQEQVEYASGQLTDDDLECWARDQAQDEVGWRTIDCDTESCQITKIE